MIMWYLLLISLGVAALLGVFHLLNKLSRPHNLTADQVADCIENFLEGRGGAWDWGEFLSFPIQDPVLERIRVRCIELPDVYPVEPGDGYCGPEGEREMRRMLAQLRELARVSRIP